MNRLAARIRGVRLFALTAAILCASALNLAADEQAAPVTLSQAVERALAQGPDIRLSGANLAAAQAKYDAAVAVNSFALGATGDLGRSEAGTARSNGQVASNPYDTADAGISMSAPLSSSMNVTASHTIFENPANVPPAQVQYPSTQLHVGASSTLWDGYPGGSGRAAVQQASLALQVNRTSEDANRKNIAYQVTQAYYTMLAQQRQLAIYQQTLAQRQEELKKTQALFDVQSANQIDLKQAQVNQAQAELDLAKAQDTLEIDRELLSALVGWPLERQYSVAEVEDLASPSLDVAEAVKAALTQRADLKQSALNLVSGDISVALAKAKGSPVVKANGSVDFNVGWGTSADPSSISTSTGWGAGVSVSLPILDAGAAAAAVKQAQLQNETLRIQQEKLVASISTGVKNAIYSLRDLRARAELSKTGLDLAQSQYDLAQLQFDNGVASNLDVLTASVALTTSKVNLAKAKSDAQLGVLALQNAMGQ
jgi:outer membrane protein